VPSSLPAGKDLYVFRYYRKIRSYWQISLEKPSVAENIIIRGPFPLPLSPLCARVRARQFPGKISTTGERNGIKKYRAAMFIRSGTAFFWDRARPRDAFHIGDLETKISEKCRSL